VKLLRFVSLVLVGVGSIAAALLSVSLASRAQTTARNASRTDVTYAHIGNPAMIVPMKNGQFLATDFGSLNRTESQILITNYSDHLIWRYNGYLDIPHSAYPMPNGDILISDTGDNRVIEVNRKSQIVWDTDKLGKGHGKLGQGTLSDGSKLAYPNDAQPLPNGDILISCRLQSRVIEITKRGRIVRSISGFLHEQHNPTLLSNGDMYIADSNADRVLEVNSKNKIVWSFGGQSHGSDILFWPRDVSPMPDGNILITDSDHDRVLEVTRSKKIIRQWTNLAQPFAAVPLPNGNILVGDGGTYGFIELNRHDKIVWELNRLHKPRASSAPSFVQNASFLHTIHTSSWILRDWDRDDALAYSLPPSQRANMGRDCQVHHIGPCSGRISYHGDSNGIYLSQVVRVVAGRRYRFSGWIKTKSVVTCYPCSYGAQGVHGHTAEYELTYGTSSGTAPAAPVLPQHSGSSGWIHDGIDFQVPTNVTSIEIACELRGQGTVWFDDVWLQKLK
jgi:hypothetical protein